MRVSMSCGILLLSPGSVSGIWRRGVLAAGLFTLALPILAGCGGEPSYPPPVPVSGKVTLKGAPLTGGKIRFVPEDSTQTLPGFGTIEADGTFEVQTHKPGDGLIPGNYIVFFDEPDLKDPSAKADTTTKLPDKYLAPGTSGVKKTIDESGGDLEINLE